MPPVITPVEETPTVAVLLDVHVNAVPEDGVTASLKIEVAKEQTVAVPVILPTEGIGFTVKL